MKTEFRSTFTRDLRRIRNRSMRNRVEEVILEIEQASNIAEVRNTRRVRRRRRHYRVRIGEYRLGLRIDGDTAVLIRLLPRDDIYRYFP